MELNWENNKIMKNNMTVEQLKQDGFEVEVSHKRVYKDLNTIHENQEDNYRVMSRHQFGKLPAEEQTNYELLNTGGITTVSLMDKNGKRLAGKAQCSNLDMFNRKRGLIIAIGRALKN